MINIIKGVQYRTISYTITNFISNSKNIKQQIIKKAPNSIRVKCKTKYGDST